MANIEKIAEAVLFGGSCACKRITYTCHSAPTTAQICNCITCRKLSGGPHQVFADVNAKSIILKDNQDQQVYKGFPNDTVNGIEYLRLSSVGERAFCTSCHTPLMMRYKPHPDVLGITLGSIDEETIVDDKVKALLKPHTHIFGSQKAFWIEDLRRDGIPVYERFSSELDQNYPNLDDALREPERLSSARDTTVLS